MNEEVFIENGLCYTSIGLHCTIGGFYLDPLKPVQHAVVSHAHADHATKGHANIYTTEATALFMKARYGPCSESVFHIIDYRQNFTINDIEICFYSAGHMLGSAQILLNIDSRRILYTGDIKLQPDVTCTPYQIVECDTLITESTFGSPDVVHPDVVEEISRISNYTSSNIVLGTYVLGKAQRLMSLIEKHIENKVVLCHTDVVKCNKVYEKFDIKFNNWIPYSRRYFKQNSNCIYLVPPKVYRYYYNKIKTVRAFASGWDKLQVDADFKIFISDHVDWNDLIYVINNSNAKKIVTLHGNGNQLKTYFDSTDLEFLIL
ncbi:MAG: exonuclease [Bacteroidetes bacterium]|nr:exonuclease [Bacteroidota bacterium]